MTAGAGQQFDPRAILAAFEREHAGYVVIGGLARVLRGANEVTTGVDICPAFGIDNPPRLTGALAELDARTADGEAVEVTEAMLSDVPVISFSTSFGELNLVAKPAGIPRGCLDLRRAATPVHLGEGLQPYVASAGDLAGMAAALHRDQDIDRLPELRRIMELEVDRQTIGPPAPRLSGSSWNFGGDPHGLMVTR